MHGTLRKNLTWSSADPTFFESSNVQSTHKIWLSCAEPSVPALFHCRFSRPAPYLSYNILRSFEILKLLFAISPFCLPCATIMN